MITMDMKKTGRWAYVALACTVFLLFVPNYAQYQLSPVAHLVMPAYNLDTAQFSMLFSSAMIPGILFSLVAGLLCDQFGAKLTVGIAGIVSVSAIVLRIFIPSFSGLFICMLLVGLLSTCINTNMAKIMGSWFPPEKLGTAVGIGLAGSNASMAIGLGTSALFPSLRSLFTFTAALAVVALAAWWLFFKDGPRTAQAEPQDGQSSPDAIPAGQPSLRECLKVVFRSRNVWLIGIALGMTLAAIMCILTFLPQALQSTRSFDPAIAGALSSVVTFGNVAGSILAPTIITRIGRFKPFVIALVVVASAGTAFAWQLPEGALMLVCFFLTGFSLGGAMALLVSAIVLLPEIGPVYAGTAGGVCATLQLFGAVVIPSYILAPILGTNYGALYGIGGFLCLIAAVCVFVLPELLKHEPQDSR